MKNPMNDAAKALCFRFDWKVTLLVVVLLPLTLGLGNWQLSRAAEKRALIAARDAGLALPAASLDKLPVAGDALRYRRVGLYGTFDAEHCFLLDNQVHQRRVGYEIICPFQDGLSAQRVLVSRGFVAAPPLRSQLPDIAAAPSAPVTLTAQVYVPTGDAMRLAELQTNPGWPKVVQVMEVEYLQSLLGAPVFPYVLRLEPDSPALIEAHWQVVNLSPEKHIGYAVQWFAMSAVLVLIAILANTNLVSWFKQRIQRD